MNTGPIIGGSRDGEQHSHHDKFCYMPVMRRVSIEYDPGGAVPFDVIDNFEELRWVPFHFHTPERDITTGFWVSLCEETRRFRDDAEFRVYVLMKLSERYIEDTPTIKKRLAARL